jgi:hypothetical protein
MPLAAKKLQSSVVISFVLLQKLEFALEICNYIFTILFTFEFIVKIVAFGPRLYFTDHWNKLDVVIVILSYVGILLEELGSGLISLNPTIIRVMRIFRIARCK